MNRESRTGTEPVHTHAGAALTGGRSEIGEIDPERR